MILLKTSVSHYLDNVSLPSTEVFCNKRSYIFMYTYIHHGNNS